MTLAPQRRVSLTDNSRVIMYDHNMFIIQAIGLGVGSEGYSKKNSCNARRASLPFESPYMLESIRTF